MKRETVAHGSLVAQYLLHITYATEKCWLAAEREKNKTNKSLAGEMWRRVTGLRQRVISRNFVSSSSSA